MPSVTVIVFSVLIAAAHTARAQDANIVADAIRHIQNDDPDPAPENRLKYVNIIEHERAVEAIPVLEGYYNRTTDADIKAGVASALVRMGDKKKTYWTYLVTLAKPAIESDAPTPIGTNTTSPEFRIWAEDHNLSLQAASTLVMEELPHDLAPLAKTGDSVECRCCAKH
jgi:hypothetical protein